MSDIVFVGEQPAKRIRFASEPVYNALCSLCLLNQDHLDRISNWVDVTRQHLTDEERAQAERACQVTQFVGGDSSTSPDSLDLPSSLDRLATADPGELRRINATRLRLKAATYLSPVDVPEVQEIISDREICVNLMYRLCVAKGCEEDFNREEEVAAFDALHDGVVFRDKIVESARHLWEKYLKEEWPKVSQTIATSVRAFESIQIPGDTIADQLKFVTEREAIPNTWVQPLELAQEVVFIPSVHIGPFMILFEYDGHTAYIVGRARIPAGSSVNAVELDRSDLLIRLEALSDGTRLRVLELAGSRGTITTQDVMDTLELSQSSASRHLTQLTATGLLAVDASERTKRYRVNSGRIDQVFDGLKDLLGAKIQAQDRGET
jgi:DNA-binding transcriptional ArsR family regulator